MYQNIIFQLYFFTDNNFESKYVIHLNRGAYASMLMGYYNRIL